MDCILYIDLFFLLHFWGNCLVLFLVRYIIKSCGALRCLFSAFFGAIVETGAVFTFLLTENGFVYVMLWIIEVVAMAFFAFGKQGILWHVILCLGIAFLVSVLHIPFRFIYAGDSSFASVFLVSAAAVFVLVSLERQCRLRWKEEHMKAKAVLEFEEKKMCTTVLMDTGNRLYDPFFHKPVILVSEAVLGDILLYCKECHPEKIQYIPYHSVGKSDGMLLGVLLDSVSIRWQEKHRIIRNVIAASTREELYRGKEYQVIFHCGLLEEIM